MTMSSKILSAILKHLKNSARKEGFDIHKYRSFLEENAKKFRIHKEVTFERFTIGNIPAAWLLPPDPPSNSVLLYIHGGGFIAGSINSHRDLASRLAKAAHQKVLMMDYRLAPENPFPAALDDIFEVYEWLLDHHYLHKDIALAGDSAGGNLALSLMLKLKASNIPLPSAAVLFSPWLDLGCCHELDTHKKNAEKDPMLNRRALYYTAQLYTAYWSENKSSGNGSEYENSGNDGGDVNFPALDHPLISPLNGDLSHLPPMLIQAGSHEVLMGDAIALAHKAEQAGTSVDLEIWEEMFHVWHYFARYLKEGREAIEKAGEWLQRQ